MIGLLRILKLPWCNNVEAWERRTNHYFLLYFHPLEQKCASQFCPNKLARSYATHKQASSRYSAQTYTLEQQQLHPTRQTSCKARWRMNERTGQQYSVN